MLSGKSFKPQEVPFKPPQTGAGGGATALQFMSPAGGEDVGGMVPPVPEPGMGGDDPQRLRALLEMLRGGG